LIFNDLQKFIFCELVVWYSIHGEVYTYFILL